jgi:FkbM family methyltransferase
MAFDKSHFLIYLQASAKPFGLYVTRLRNTLESKRGQVLRRGDIAAVLDVGANVGQYASVVRRAGYRGPILSFEPAAGPFAELTKHSRKDPQHRCYNMALGNSAGNADLYVAANTVASSLRRITDLNLGASASSAPRSTETVPVARLDALDGGIIPEGGSLYLKIDAQGFEKEILMGGCGILNRVAAVEVELSFVPLYDGQALLPEVWTLLQSNGFVPVWFERGFMHPQSGYLLQADALFLKDSQGGHRG